MAVVALAVAALKSDNRFSPLFSLLTVSHDRVSVSGVFKISVLVLSSTRARVFSPLLWECGTCLGCLLHSCPLMTSGGVTTISSWPLWIGNDWLVGLIMAGAAAKTVYCFRFCSGMLLLLG